MLDQIIVSQAMVTPKQGIHTTYGGGKIFRADWMMFHDENRSQDVPSRTYGGPNYYGGVSDHLPVYAILRSDE